MSIQPLLSARFFARVTVLIALLVTLLPAALSREESGTSVEFDPGRAPVPTLFRARDEVEAPIVWPRTDDDGYGLTGRGVVVAVLDNPPDIFHPMLFRDDGGRFSWIDVDGNGTWSRGDAVDRNANGLADAGETLSWLRIEGADDLPGRDTTRFQAGYDFLYLDANENGVRDYGWPEFREEDLCYGERLFIVDDRNQNSWVDPGEDLVGLGTSKVRAILGLGRVYRRGENLIEFPSSNDHGTSVCGIVAGGWAGKHRLSGIAPDAELLIAHDDFLWAREEGADVLLVEFSTGSSDGSDYNERLVDELARGGIIVVTPAGNERRQAEHIEFVDDQVRHLRTGGLEDLGLGCFLRGSLPREIRISLPEDSTVTFAITGNGSEDVAGWQTYTALDLTWRGTQSMFVFLHPAEPLPDDTVGVSFPGWKGRLHAFTETDDPNLEDRRWEGSDWKYSAGSPGTADSAITVGAYDNDPVGRMAWFSGEGPRVDGRPVVTVVAPGVRVLTADARGPRFGLFTGTSASAPFVAGAAALLKQAFPEMDSGLFRSLLARGAVRDSLTQNADWCGAGRLRINASLAAGLAHRSSVIGGSRLAVGASPNPASGPAEISWESSGSPAEVRVFSVTGRLVWEAAVSARVGLARAAWDGRDAQGMAVAAGVYFAHVRDGDRTGVTRIVRVR